MDFFVIFHTRTMHLLHGVGASAKIPVLWHFAYINCCNSHQIIINGHEIWRECELQLFLCTSHFMESIIYITLTVLFLGDMITI